MRLTRFIEQHRKQILAEWVKFAGTLLPWAAGMSTKDLRDHADALLTAVVRDMKLPQSDAEQTKKSKGMADDGALGRVGHKHASERLNTGLNLDQLVSEYRALRASVLRLWEGAQGDKQGEVTRFNEAIDETLAESAARYSDIVSKTREQFLAILGHDLRNPLSAVVAGATVLTKSESIDDQQARTATRILSSAERMSRMVSDLLDLTRTRLGAGIPLAPKRMDLASVCELVISELEAVHPACQLRFQAEGDLHGKWDSDRLTQVISNLVANAVQYGCKEGPVSVVAQGRGKDIVLQIHNGGPPIPGRAMRKIFEPMVRLQSPTRSGEGNATGLGLGLYIAREVVLAHGGTIEATSKKKEGTTFTVLLPRRSATSQKRAGAAHDGRAVARPFHAPFGESHAHAAMH